ncbi:MAG TPA: undecaprenyl-diphosphate phosphatase [Ktedonobacteraceae bacterium]|jgi:undecaprenyl-diphosphatase|nr:undecaprenyl-diphosphate phosphatase [Ktedonobacteraceae bacterium]
MNLNIWQILVLALLQGVTELFPISSLGHTVILPGLLGWGDLVRNQQFLPLIVALHLGTSIALVVYFWRDWYQVGRSVVVSLKQGEIRRGTQEWVGWLIIIGCIPAGLLGVTLETPLKQLFATPLVAASFLVVNGCILFVGEVLRRRSERRAMSSSTERQRAFQPGEGAGLPVDQQAMYPLPSRMVEPSSGNAGVLTATDMPKPRAAQARSLADLSWKEALLIGLAQSLALIPGISRSGVTMVAGLGIGLNHEEAARYSFLLGTPLIGAAAILEVPQLFGLPATTLLLVLIGMGVSGVAAFLSTKFLLKYFETGRLYPFAYYCWGAGLLSLLLFLTIR